MAIISNDSDFCIFDGSWRLWSSMGIIRSKLQLKTVEYYRQRIQRILSLTTDQLPLLATMAGNDTTNSKTLHLKLDNFYKKLGPPEQKMRNIAKFIRDLGDSVNFKRISDENIRHIVEKIFGHPNSTWEGLFRQSIDSYNTNSKTVTSTDPIEKKLRDSDMYRPYMENICTIQSISMSFYDLRGGATAENVLNFPHLLIEWIQRKKGILMNNAKDTASTFTILIKKEFDEKFMAHTETVTHPNCK